MLLLVLILVLLAFALLVVALLTGNVLAAWISVGLSIVAAVVLLIDWLQRRAAVKAGDASLLSSDAGLMRTPEPPRAQYEPEPATEVLPVVPLTGLPSGTSDTRQAEVGTVRTAAPPVPDEGPVGHGESRPASGLSSDDEAHVGSQNTVLISPVQPSGSAAQPSGAEGGITSSSGSSSPSVTKLGSGPALIGSADGTDAVANVDQKTAFVDTRKKTEAVPPVTEESVDPAAATADHQPPSAVAPAAAEHVPAQGAVGSSLSGSDLFGGGAAAFEQQPVVDQQQAVEQHSAVEQRSAVEQHSAFEQQPAVGVPPTADTSDDAEPSEEHASAEAVALVAGLEDEVIVIDEQPRYHVPGCRALSAQTPIPLPAREAVDLGFTPCGWCCPDRTLAERHPAAAH